MKPNAPQLNCKLFHQPTEERPGGKVLDENPPETAAPARLVEREGLSRLELLLHLQPRPDRRAEPRQIPAELLRPVKR